ncbi:hypothetical protein [Leminorella grimontii]|uniref:hypothetical protein n=1 Tax=Leminorella grimontii TaxID=82981 RepID=UPI001069C144|nr:hypothetical protein [Leminorella grimontii]
MARENVTLRSQSLNNGGQLAAARDITVQTNGNVTNRNDAAITAGSQLSINADGLANDGAISAQSDVAVTAKRRINNTGRVSSGGRATIKAQQLDNAGTVYSIGSGNYSVDIFQQQQHVC